MSGVTLGDFVWSGARSPAHISHPNPVLSAGDTQFVGMTWANATDCQNCLRLELGCGNAPTLAENQRCLKTAERIAGVIVGGCNGMEAGVLAPFDIGLATSCKSVCSKHTELEFGTGYARPYRSNAVELTQGGDKESTNPL